MFGTLREVAMTRFAILLMILFSWTPAMAVQGNTNIEPSLVPLTEQEQFLASPRGQELQAIFDLGQKEGGAAMQPAYDAYRQKYNVPSREERLRMIMERGGYSGSPNRQGR